MSDQSITTIVTGVVTIALAIIGYLDMRAKLKRSNEQASQAADKAKIAAEKAKIVEAKIDANTMLTEKIDEQTNGGLDKRLEKFADHDHRIAVLEAAVSEVKNQVASFEGKLDSHMKTIINIISVKGLPDAK